MMIAKKMMLGMMASILWITISHGQVPADNVVAYFPFNGNATDVSANGNTTTDITAATLTTDRLGKANAAYSFNGSSSIIKLPNALLPVNTAFAISCWVKILGNHATTDQAQTIIDLRGQYQIALSFSQSNNPTNPGSFSFYIYSSPTAAVINSPNNSVLANTWYHIVGNYGNNSMELYVNGALIGTQTTSPPGIVSNYNNTIGKDYNLSLDRSWVYGNIDELILYKRKLTSTEVQSIYNRELVQNELPELYGPISFNYDAAGNRQSRNVISLKKAKVINVHDSIVGENLGQKSTSLLELDSLKYTDLDQMVKIYPNPTKGQLQTELSGFDFTQKTGIYVYSPSGTLLLQKVPANPTDVIDLSSYPAGIYIMRIIIGDKVSEWKILKD